MISPGPVITSLPASGSNVNKAELPDNALVLPPTHQLQALLTIIRDEKTQRWVSCRHDDGVHTADVELEEILSCKPPRP